MSITRRPENMWSVRTSEGVLLGPFSTEEVLERIRRGEFVGEEMISPYPGHQWRPISRNPEFYDDLLKMLSRTPGTGSEDQKQPAEQQDDLEEDLAVESTQPPLSSSDQEVTHAPPPRKEEVPHRPRSSAKNKKSSRSRSSRRRSNEDIEMIDTLKEGRRAKLKRAKLPIALAVMAIVGGLYIVFFGPEGLDNEFRLRLLAPRGRISTMNTQQADERWQRGLNAFFKDTYSTYVKAQNDFVALAENDDRNSQALSMLCLTYLELWPFAFQDAEDLRALARVTQLAGAIDPGGMHAATCKSVDLMIKGRYSEAGYLIDSIIESHGQSQQPPTPFYYLKSILLSFNGDLSGSSDYAAFSYKLWPDWVRPLFFQGEIAAKSERPEDAARLFRQVLTSNPGHVSAMVELGLLEFRNFRNYDRAQTLISSAVSGSERMSRRRLSRGYLGLAEIALWRKKSGEALSYAKQAYQSDSTNTIAKNLVVQLGGKKELTKTKFKGYQLIAEGDQFFREGDCNAAQAHYKAAFEAEEKNGIAALKAAECLWRLSLSTEAIEWLNKAIVADPKLIEAYVRLADYYSDRYNFSAAAQTLLSAQRIAPKSYEVFRGFALIEIRRGNAKAAVDFAKQGLALYDADVETHVLMAEALILLGDSSEAFRHAAKAVELDVNHRKAQTTYGRALAAARGVADGINYLKQLVERYPMVSEYRLGLGKLLLEDERFADAEDVFRQLTGIDDKLKDAYLFLGKTLRSQGRAADALEALLRAAVADPADAEPLYVSGLLYLENGKPREARIQFDRVKAINKLYPLVHYQIGRSWLMEGSPERALAESKLERQTNPELADAYILGAEAYTAMRQYSLCVGEYQKAIKFRPQSAHIHLKMAQCYRKSDQLDTAIAMLNHAAEKESGLAEIYKELGIIYELKGDAARAVESYNQYFVLDPSAKDRMQIQQRIEMLQRGR